MNIKCACARGYTALGHRVGVCDEEINLFLCFFTNQENENENTLLLTNNFFYVLPAAFLLTLYNNAIRPRGK